MKPQAELDRKIDLYLKDGASESSPDFTARTLDRIALEQASESHSVERRSWWFLWPIAAAVAITFLLPRGEMVDPIDHNAKVVDSTDAASKSGRTAQPPVAEMEEMFVMEESLRDFEILFDDDALDILALLEE